MGRGEFDPRLESLRGIAALVVCAHHGMSAFAGYSSVAPLDWLLSALSPAAAVMFFFVLSGYVLGRALERDENFLKYIVRRLFRIIPPFVFAVLFAFACVTFIRIDPVPPGLTTFFQRPFWPQPTASQLWDNLVFNSSWINGPTWSIWPELVGSTLLPILVYAHAKIAHRFRWQLFIALSILIAFSQYKLLLWFYAGYFLSREVGLAIRERKLLALIMFLVGLAGLKMTADHAVYYKAATVLPSAISGALMIGAVVSSPNVMRWTTISPLRFLGRVSYSLYLLHWPVFYLCVIFCATYPAIFPSGAPNNIFVMLLSVIVTVVFAAASYKLVELPAMRAGKYFARRFFTKQSEQAAAAAAG